MLGERDWGRYRSLSAQLGLRADIGDGWEEILTKVTTTTTAAAAAATAADF